MAKYEYITADDITDKVTYNSDLTDYIADANNAIEHLASTLSVDADYIEREPLNMKVKKYGIYYATMHYCLDRAGINNNSIPADIETYTVKHKLYSKLLAELERQITWQMMTGDADEREEFSQVNRIYFG